MNRGNRRIYGANDGGAASNGGLAATLFCGRAKGSGAFRAMIESGYRAVVDCSDV
jgi:hypothetical protein